MTNPKKSMPKKAGKPKKGRPSSFTQKLADKMCERLAGGESLRSICDEPGYPTKTTVLRWLKTDEAFRAQYSQAREDQADALFDEILTIADDGQNDWMEKKSADGGNMGWTENGEAMRRSQLRIDARKWMAGKLRPKKYGDAMKLEHGVSNDLADLMRDLDGKTRGLPGGT